MSFLPVSDAGVSLDDLFVCPTCCAIVLPGDTEEHKRYHAEPNGLLRLLRQLADYADVADADDSMDDTTRHQLHDLIDLIELLS